MAVYKEQAVNATPTRNAVAASNTFHFCKPHPKPDRYVILCEACDVTLHLKKTEDGARFGLVAYATLMEHDLKDRDGDGIKISRSGELADEDFRSDMFDAQTGRVLFAKANAWCQSQQNGEFQILKDEIDVQLGSKG